MGAMASEISDRCSFRRGPLASRSHTPPPKSAPPKRTYAVSETRIAPASTAASTFGVVASGMRFPFGQPHAAPIRNRRALQDLAPHQPDHADREQDVEQG